jgi:hypothetical protein
MNEKQQDADTLRSVAHSTIPINRGVAQMVAERAVKRGWIHEESLYSNNFHQLADMIESA